jgi:hypothetical protein
MENTNDAAKVPLSYWLVAVLGFLWNCFGAYLYTMYSMGDPATVASGTPAMQEYAANQPLWAYTGWALGIWASLAGSVLMLLRLRHAVTAFLVSLAGALVSFAAQAMAGVIDPPITVTVLAVIVFLWWFCKRAAGAGTLK